ncbi:hypothetical protein RJT34_30742 [Clitoria ternatea]|uniref:HXXXD-type acyl-transferase family protein n=1 Tax=Clitoria ternatea TaxID=43366 RepID=A0AAN9ETE0_CLITE
MAMEGVRIISSGMIQAPTQNNRDSTPKMDLTPWDIFFLPFEGIQKGLLFCKEERASSQIKHLKHSLSSTLAFFPPLTGRLATVQHPINTVSYHIVCDNVGALFVHAVAHNTTVADILQPHYVPPILRSFFPLNGVKNYQGTSQPLLAVQVTELLDGTFIGCTVNHAVADGKSFWHFMNSWAEISRGSHKISKLPSFERFFFNGINRPIRFPFAKKEQKEEKHSKTPPERFFHFTKEKIAQLKSKANAEANTDKISSLQALLTHLWRSVIRCKGVDPQEEMIYLLIIGVRPRMVPPLAEDYFGNAMVCDFVRVKGGELLLGGLGKGALEMNKLISLCTHEKIRNTYECMAENPWGGMVSSSKFLATSSSPRFNVYGNDFGWGKPVAVRSGAANKRNGKVTVFCGAEEGSIDIELCLPYQILEAIGTDPEFMEAETISG